MKYLILLFLIFGCSKDIEIPLSLQRATESCKYISNNLKMNYRILEDIKENKILYTCNLISVDGNMERFINYLEIESVEQILKDKDNLPNRPKFVECCNKLKCYERSLSTIETIQRLDICSKKSGYKWDESL